MLAMKVWCMMCVAAHSSQEAGYSSSRGTAKARLQEGRFLGCWGYPAKGQPRSTRVCHLHAGQLRRSTGDVQALAGTRRRPATQTPMRRPPAQAPAQPGPLPQRHDQHRPAFGTLDVKAIAVDAELVILDRRLHILPGSALHAALMACARRHGLALQLRLQVQGGRRVYLVAALMVPMFHLWQCDIVLPPSISEAVVPPAVLPAGLYHSNSLVAKVRISVCAGLTMEQASTLSAALPLLVAGRHTHAGAYAAGPSAGILDNGMPR